MTAENIASHLEKASLRLPDKKAILSANGQSFPEKSFLELYQDVKATAAYLKSRGVKKHDKTLLFVRSGYELIVLAFSLFFLGAVPIIIDPGIGFGKNLKHNINLISNISIFHSLGFPVLVGNSKKRFIKEISGNNDTKDRIGGTVASSIYLMMQGIQILRIHDVNELLQGIKVFKKIINH